MGWRVFLFLSLLAALAASSFVSSEPSACCVCRYQNDTFGSGYIRDACEDWLSRPEQQSACAQRIILPLAVNELNQCMSMPSECRGLPTIIEQYYGHRFSSQLDYLRNLFQMCLDNSCSVYGVNTGCSTLDDPQELQRTLDYIRPRLPQGVTLSVTGMQCESVGGWADAPLIGPLLTCSNVPCTVQASCTDSRQTLPQCSDYVDGLCFATNARVACIDNKGINQTLTCCAGETLVPGFGRWVLGKTCQDLSVMKCQGRCCSCGIGLNGQTCKYCQDQNGIGSGGPGSKLRVRITHYNETIDCPHCSVQCIKQRVDDYSMSNDRLPCGEWNWYIDAGSQIVRKQCGGSGWSGLPEVGSVPTNSWSGVTSTALLCSVDQLTKIRDFRSNPLLPLDESDCYHYTKREWCGGVLVPTVQIYVESKDTSTCKL